MKFLKTALALFLISFYSSFLMSYEKKNDKDYQIEIDAKNDSLVFNVYDHSRYVGSASPATIEELLINDNQ